MISFNGLRSWAAFSTGCLLIICGCQGTPNSPPSNRLKVVATIFPLADWARQVGGTRVDVVTLLPPGSSPHTFEAAPKEMRELSSANLFLMVGLHMDDWGAQLAEGATVGGLVKTVSLGDWLHSSHQLPEVKEISMVGDKEAHEGHDHAGHDHHDHEGAVNPHFWLDPALATLCVDKITSELTTADPAGASYFLERSVMYKSQLVELDKESSAALANCQGKSFVSFHNAFPYLAQRYGLNLAAVIEEYPGKTPSDNYVKAVTDRLRELKITTVFSEPQLNPKPAEIIAGAVGAKVDLLDPYGSETVKDRDTFIGLVRFNVNKLKMALCGGHP